MTNMLFFDLSGAKREDAMCWLNKIFPCQSSPPAPRVVFTVKVAELGNAAVAKTPQYKKWPLLGEIDMALELQDSQYSDLVVSAVKDKKGNPAQLTDPVWSTDNSDVLALEPTADGMGCRVKATGQLGTAKVQFSADGDIGPGVSSVIGTLDVNVVSGPATTVELTAGPATEIPDVPAPTPAP